MDSIEVKPTPPSGFILDSRGYVPKPPAGFILDAPGYGPTPSPGFVLDKKETAAEKVLGGEIGQIIGREPLELEKKPGLKYILGETLKGTGGDVLKALQNLMKQSGQFLTHQVAGIREPEEAAANFMLLYRQKLKKPQKRP